MDGPYYTLATWHVRPGEEDQFVEAWKAMGDAFAAVPDSPGATGTLLRRTDDPSVFVSFGAWPDLDDIHRMRQDPGAKEAMARAMAHCTRADPGSYQRIATAPPPAATAPANARPAGP